MEGGNSNFVLSEHTVIADFNDTIWSGLMGASNQGYDVNVSYEIFPSQEQMQSEGALPDKVIIGRLNSSEKLILPLIDTGGLVNPQYGAIVNAGGGRIKGIFATPRYAYDTYADFQITAYVLIS